MKDCEYKNEEVCPDTETEHTCPYREDINGDSETMCNCCPCDEHECAMDI